MISIKDVAEAAGVSHQTASSVLTGKARERRIGPETEQRVRTVATNLGYRPNAGARSLREKRVGAIGLLLGASGSENFLPVGLLKNLEREAHARNQRLLISHVHDERLDDPAYVPGLLCELAVDGLVIDYISNGPQRMSKLIDRYHVPSIWMNSKWTHSAVYLDDEGLGRQAVALFAGLGHRRLGYFALKSAVQPGQHPHYSLTDRPAGMRSAAADTGCAFANLCLEGSLADPGTVMQLAEALRRPDGPTAVLADGERAASAVVTAARFAGLDVPGDLSVVAIHPDVAVTPGLALDTYILPQGPLARQSVGELSALIDEPDRPRPCVAIPFGAAHACGSVAPPRKLPRNHPKKEVRP